MNSKKSIIALLLVAIIGVVGLTMAYFTNTANIENEFRTNSYGTTVVEEFVSPDNWTPGTTTNKTLIVTNSGNIDEAVRVEYIESWTSKNGDSLPLKQNGNDAAIINWANTDDWTPVTENNKNYYYYNYKLAPTEVTSTLLDSVTFNPLITNDSNCQTTEANGTTTITCNPTENGYDGATYTLTFKVQTVQYDKYTEAWGTSFDIAAEKQHPGTQYLVEHATNSVNTEYNSETKGNMFIFTHGEEPNQVTDYRYIGDDPKNYVKFNCDNDGTNCEVWRIIGIFDVERPDPEDNTQTITEKRIKLLRGNTFDNYMPWNSKYTGIYGENVWTVASLQEFLNGAYLNRTGDAETYGLKESARDMIDNAKYYLGGEASSTQSSTEEMYAWERLTDVWSGRPTSIVREIGLMYPSDLFMTYGNGVNDSCYNQPSSSGCNSIKAQSGWIYNSNVMLGQSESLNIWFLNPVSDQPTQVFTMYSGYRGSAAGNANFTVRPVVYLSADVEINGGTGEIDQPYILKKNNN